MSQAAAGRPQSGRGSLVGRTFVGPAFDYLLIGGGLSLIVTFLVWQAPSLRRLDPMIAPYLMLVANSAHFASSTVRLYTKPGAFESWPRLTMVFPLIALALLTVCMFFPGSLGASLQSLYLTWSPYHYAAQAYGLAVMYSYRSGCLLNDSDKRLLRWVSLLPFFYNFTFGADLGLHWLVPGAWIRLPAVELVMQVLYVGLPVLAFVTPALLFARVSRGKAQPMPLISLLVILSNGVWFLVLDSLSAFVWATIFHSLQYLAIIVIFHVKDQMAVPGNSQTAFYHGLRFYALSLVLAYGLFQCLPMAYMWAGFGAVESWLLVFAAINLHHFIVDGFIWRFDKKDRGGANRRIVDSGVSAGQS